MLHTSCNDDEQVFSCTLDPVPPPCNRLASFTNIVDTCFQINWQGPNFENFQTGVDTFFGTAAYHNNDPNLFTYIRNSAVTNSEKWQIDLCKGEFTLVGDNNIFGGIALRPGPNDWITFGSSDGRTYISKINGDSLKELLPELACRRPVFVGTESILCNCLFPAPIYFKNITMDLSGEITDTMDISSANYAHMDGRVCGLHKPSGEDNSSFGYLNISTQEFTTLHPWSDESYGSTKDMGWLDDENIIWISEKGIFQLDLITTEVTTLKEVCENVNYNLISVIPENNEVLISRTDRWHIAHATIPDVDTIYSQTRISIFDIETGEEQFVDLE